MILHVISRRTLSTKARLGLGAGFAAIGLVASGALVGTSEAQVPEMTYTPNVVVKQQPTAKRDATMRRDCFVPNCYGAIYLANGDSKVGWAYNYAHKWRAKRAALRSCHSRTAYPRTCHGKGWVRNGCLALAIKKRPNNTVARAASGIASTKRAAYREALRRCGIRVCMKRAFVCTARS
jgi:hypothetical protein